MKSVEPDDTLAKIVGSKPLPRTEVTKKLWDYIKKHKLQNAKKKTLINADDALKAVFGGKKQVPMFEMAKHVSGHVKLQLYSCRSCHSLAESYFGFSLRDQMKREPTQEEREKIVRAIATRDRIGATSMYISITECNLTEAQKCIKALTTELELELPEKNAKRQHKRRWV
jgi:hypothetical protein